MSSPQKKALLISIPHSGERVPPETPWLARLPERLLMYDVDRYVDVLYGPALKQLGIEPVQTEWHRYACDLNRLAGDVDSDSVEGSENPSGAFPRGLHWSITTQGERLMPTPMPQSVHDAIVRLYFEPFHERARAGLRALRDAGARETFHVDLHSMPSVGTKEHRDPGERRADIVVSDCEGKSCSTPFKDAVIEAYRSAGFEVRYNWPYKGGRLTETYGQPASGQHAIQVELNRSLYMDETTKRLHPERPGLEYHKDLSARLGKALGAIHEFLPSVSGD